MVFVAVFMELIATNVLFKSLDSLGSRRWVQGRHGSKWTRGGDNRKRRRGKIWRAGTGRRRSPRNSVGVSCQWRPRRWGRRDRWWSGGMRTETSKWWTNSSWNIGIIWKTIVEMFICRSLHDDLFISPAPATQGSPVCTGRGKEEIKMTEWTLLWKS